MNIQFCVIREKATGNLLCNRYDEGYHYSEMTNCSPSVNVAYAPMYKCFGTKNLEDDECSLVLFESREKADKWLQKNYGASKYQPYTAHAYEVLSFAEVDLVMEQYLLGNVE